MKLTEQEEMELLKQYQETKDIKAFKKLRASLRPLIRGIIKNNLPKDGSVTEAQIAIRIDSKLPQALLEYNPAFGAKLNTHLTTFIKGHVQNAVSENVTGAHVPRPEHGNLFRYQQARSQAQLEFGKNPTPEQILKMNPKLKSVEEVNRIAQYDSRTLVGDHKAGSEEEGFVAFKDQFDAYDASKDQSLHLKLDELRSLKNEFPLDEQKVIEEYVFNERSMLDTSLRTGMSSSKVRRIVQKWKQRVEEKGI